MESPFEATSWDGISGAIYTGAGSVEWLWVALSLTAVVVAVIAGWQHEKHAYEAVENGKH